MAMVSPSVPKAAVREMHFGSSCRTKNKTLNGAFSGVSEARTVAVDNIASARVSNDTVARRMSGQDTSREVGCSTGNG
jgi:hypothetical protein